MAHNTESRDKFRSKITPKTGVIVLALMAIALTVGYGGMHAVKIMMRPPSPFVQVEEDPSLPRVLLLGDSISIDYTWPVREELTDIANVQRANVNCESTIKGLELLDEWLGDKPWDVIHFNFGLHDLKYMDENGKFVVEVQDGVQQVPIDQYEENLEKIVERLEKTKAVLIWRTITPVPEGADGRIAGDAARYNEVAIKVMKKHGIAVHDLYAFCLRLHEIQLPANVHFTPEGSTLLGKEVANVIKKHLAHLHQSHGPPK